MTTPWQVTWCKFLSDMRVIALLAEFFKWFSKRWDFLFAKTRNLPKLWSIAYILCWIQCVKSKKWRCLDGSCKEVGSTKGRFLYMVMSPTFTRNTLRVLSLCFICTCALFDAETAFRSILVVSLLLLHDLVSVKIYTFRESLMKSPRNLDFYGRNSPLTVKSEHLESDKNS